MGEILEKRSLISIVSAAESHGFAGVIFVATNLQEEVVEAVLRREMMQNKQRWDGVRRPVFFSIMKGITATADSEEDAIMPAREDETTPMHIVSFDAMVSSLDRRDCTQDFTLKFKEGHVKGRALLGAAKGQQVSSEMLLPGDNMATRAAAHMSINFTK